VAHELRDLTSAERVLRAQHDRDAEPPEAVGGDQSDRVGAPGQQRPGQHVRREPELTRGGGDPLSGLGPQLALAVERLGRGADRNARLGCDIPDRRPPGVRPWFYLRQTVAPIYGRSTPFHIAPNCALYRP